MTGLFPNWYLTLGNSSKDIFDGRDRQALDKVHVFTNSHIGIGRYFEIQRSNFPFH
jgi:hypothetical protein